MLSAFLMEPQSPFAESASANSRIIILTGIWRHAEMFSSAGKNDRDMRMVENAHSGYPANGGNSLRQLE